MWKIETRPYLCVSALGRPCPHWQRWGGRACASLAPSACVPLISWEDPSSSISPSKETLHLVVPPPAFPASHLQMEISEKLLGFMRTQKDGGKFYNLTIHNGFFGITELLVTNTATAKNSLPAQTRVLHLRIKVGHVEQSEDRGAQFAAYEDIRCTERSQVDWIYTFFRTRK